ncbi:hypothetical protein HY989_04530 [Candidatus Micrarchaeota archaeon]|nr:hypothetical protein [Candidatus Micrarchaeota archaeon]
MELEESKAHKKIAQYFEGTLFYEHVSRAFYRQTKSPIKQVKHEEDVIDAIDTEINLTGNAPRYLENSKMKFPELADYRRKLIAAKSHLLQKLGKG